MATFTVQLLAASYGREAISTLPLEGIDAVFATARTDFGGYSHAYSSFIFEYLGLNQSPHSLRASSAREGGAASVYSILDSHSCGTQR